MIASLAYSIFVCHEVLKGDSGRFNKVVAHLLHGTQSEYLVSLIVNQKSYLYCSDANPDLRFF